jgi:hypothetical protein
MARTARSVGLILLGFAMWIGVFFPADVSEAASRNVVRGLQDLSKQVEVLRGRVEALESRSDDSVAELQAQLTALARQLNDLQAQLSDERAARQAAESLLGSGIGDLGGQVSALRSDLSIEVAARQAADSGLGAQISGLSGQIGSLQSGLAAEETARQGGDSQLGARLDALQSNLSLEAAARQNGDAQIQSQINTNADLSGDIAGAVEICPGDVPVSGAWVFLPGRSYIAVTDELGGFVLNDVPEGTYALRVEVGGKLFATRDNVQVSRGAPTDLGTICEPFEPAAVRIWKYTNAEQADAPPGPTIPVGSAVTWSYLVTNTGAVALSNVVVTDNRGVAVTCPVTALDPGESMTCTGAGTAVAGQYSNAGTVTGRSPLGIVATDQNLSHYFGHTVGNQGCTPGYWKNHTDSWPPTGYSTSQKVSSVFFEAGWYVSQGNATLLEALSFGGGSGVEGAAEILLRAAVAALLNASHPDVACPRTQASVISDVNVALAWRETDMMLAWAAQLDADNNLGCPLH